MWTSSGTFAAALAGSGDTAAARIDVADRQLLRLFQALFNETYQGMWTRDRKAGSLPAHFHVRRVEQVWNLHSWAAYVGYRSRFGTRLHEDLQKGSVLSRLGAEKHSELPITSHIANGILAHCHAVTPVGRLPSDEDPTAPLQPALNEALLFHGTSPPAASAIASTNFKIFKAAAHGSLFGRGIYLAESCTKSDEYSETDAGSGQRPMLLCRATLGRVLYCDDSLPNGKALESKCTGGVAAKWHSVLGDRQKSSGTFREFIVYNTEAVTPLFLIWYDETTRGDERDEGNRQSSSAERDEGNRRRSTSSECDEVNVRTSLGTRGRSLGKSVQFHVDEGSVPEEPTTIAAV